MAIINPWWFYLIDMFEGLDSSFWLLGFLSLIAVGVCLIGYVAQTIEKSDWADDKTNKYYLIAESYCEIFKKWLKVSATLCIVFSIFAVAIPSKETMYTMMVANLVTYENVEIATDAIKDGVDYIFEKLDIDEND